MKSKGPELGSLSSRFFSYVQLRKLDIVRTGEIAPILDISASQERDLFRRLSDSGWILRLKRGVYLVPPRIPAGGKYSPGVALILQKLMEEVQGGYQICGPTAFHFYGFDDQIPSVTYLYNNRISGKRSIGSLAFQFIKVGDERLGAINAVSTRGNLEMVYSSKARTLMDAVYDWSRFNSLPRGYEWIKGEVKKEPKIFSELVEVTAEFGNMATIRRVGYLLDTYGREPKMMNRLLSQLSASSSLIPWIPGRSAKGTINRKWGIVING
ncbi:MAG: type IV toxin-antitoxin system AbiEi family antitoxin domain-containing protein [Deltaproteobacteria bacterium]|nr:type IV toxin-antitoxin system AbiEi family antitoxin domain-containing protein [Deltaproteobacteria bacterium]